MRNYWTVLIILTLALLPIALLSCSKSGGFSFTEVKLYSDVNYSGVEDILAGSSPDLSRNTIGDDNVSSIRVPGGTTVVLYRDTNYQGVSETFTEDDPDLSDNVIGNDTASSIEIR
jgi:Peptidase inhibitor family I36